MSLANDSNEYQRFTTKERKFGVRVCSQVYVQGRKLHIFHVCEKKFVREKKTG